MAPQNKMKTSSQIDFVQSINNQKQFLLDLICYKYIFMLNSTAKYTEKQLR